MAMRDINTPIYTFSYDKLKTPEYKYIKDDSLKIHLIKITEYVTKHNASDRKEKPYVYAKYQVKVKKRVEGKLKRILNILQNKEDVIKENWLDIKSDFYTGGFYSSFSPSGLVKKERLYDSYKEAINGEASHIFRNYNLKETK